MFDTAKVDDETEKKLLSYNNLLHAHMIPKIANKKVEEQRKVMKTWIEPVLKKHNEILNELHHLEMGILDIQDLTFLNVESDNLILEVNNKLSLIKKYDINQLLRKLKRLFKSVIVLNTENIKLPESEKEMEEFLSVVKKLSESLRSIGSAKSIETLVSAKINFNNFSERVTEIQDTFTRLSNMINELQITLMKNTSSTLAQS